MITKTPITEEMIQTANVVESEEARNSPRTLLKTPLKLTRLQEDRLMELIKNGYGQLKTEMESAPKDQPGEIAESFWNRRDRLMAHYKNDVKARRLQGGIWQVSNLTLNLSRTYTRRMIAKATNYFFGTDPWFGIYPEGIEDKEKADKMERYGRWKVSKTPCKSAMLSALEAIFARSEAVVKTIYKDEVTQFRCVKNVLIDEKGELLLTSDGDYIFDDDAWVDDPAALKQVEEEGKPQGLLPRMGQKWQEFKDNIFGPAGAPQVLKKDPSIVKPSTLVWKSMEIDRTLQVFQGPESSLVPHRNFLCGLKEKSVETASMIGHIYDRPVYWLAQTLNAYDPAIDNLSPVEQAVLEQNALKLLKSNYVPPSQAAAVESTQEDADSEDGSSKDQTKLGCIRIGEFHLIADSNGDGMPERITAVVDRRNWCPIYYNYTDNVTATGKRPFNVARCMEVENAWYGIGMMEIFEAAQEFIDKCVNRIEGRNGESGRVTIWNPFLTKEGQSDPTLKLNHGKTYTAKDSDTDPAKILSYITLPALNDNTYKIMELVMQVLQQESGVVTADASAISGLDQTKLATGIRNIERAGNELFGLYLQVLEQGMTQILKANLDIIFARMDRKEVFTYMNGNARELLEITPEEVRGTSFDVDLLMTRQKSEENLQQSMQGIQLMGDYYTRYSPEIQEALKPVYIEAMKALGFKDAESIVNPLALPMPVDPAMQGASQPESGAPAAAPQSPAAPTPVL